MATLTWNQHSTPFLNTLRDAASLLHYFWQHCLERQQQSIGYMFQRGHYTPLGKHQQNQGIPGPDWEKSMRFLVQYQAFGQRRPWSSLNVFSSSWVVFYTYLLCLHYDLALFHWSRQPFEARLQQEICLQPVFLACFTGATTSCRPRYSYSTSLTMVGQSFFGGHALNSDISWQDLLCIQSAIAKLVTTVR